MTHDKHPHPHADAGGDQDAYWKRAHHDWKFWIALVLMLIAMGVYISTLDLAVQPDAQSQQKIQQPLP